MMCNFMEKFHAEAVFFSCRQFGIFGLFCGWFKADPKFLAPLENVSLPKNLNDGENENL